MGYKERQRNVKWTEYYQMILGSRCHFIKCSNCGFNSRKKYACCPLCGSHMENGEEIHDDKEILL